MFPRFLVLCLLLLCGNGHAFTGSEACKGCHGAEFENWQGSHHDLAMQLPTPQTVLGNFDDATFSYNG
ncbi:MAG: hypothetical protein KA159_06995, partial [Halioglobus sp.]|nr:hypothetical protein [Halioglobus sp.]